MFELSFNAIFGNKTIDTTTNNQDDFKSEDEGINLEIDFSLLETEND